MVADNNNNIPGMAKGYFSAGNATTNVPDVGWKLPAGGFASSIYHLARYMLGLMNSEIINDTTSAIMWTPQPLSSGSNTNFGLGVFIDQSSGDLGVWHNGQSGNMSNTLMDFFPNQKLGIVIMTNAGWSISTVFPLLVDLKNDILDIVRCPATRVFNNDIFVGVDLHFEAANLIEVSNTDFFDTKITLDAGNKVVLKPGTYIDGGKPFRIRIDGCSTNTPPMRVAFDPSNKENSSVVVDETTASVPEPLRIMPNPFRDVVKMIYTVKEAAMVNLVLYDMYGKEVAKPVNNELKDSGAYQIAFDGHTLPKGIYLYHLQIGTEALKGKLIKVQ
jgi:hypothetical protein